MVRPLIASFFKFIGQERFALIYPALHNFCGFKASFPIRLGRCGSTDGPSTCLPRNISAGSTSRTLRRVRTG
jgi:hypothetical protein